MNNNFRKKKLESELKRVTKILRNKYIPQQLILFGSFVNGEINEDSDIDMVIIKETNKKITERIGDVIKLCKPKMAMDFIVYTPKEFLKLKEGEDFIKEEVIKKGKVIYEKV